MRNYRIKKNWLLWLLLVGVLSCGYGLAEDKKDEAPRDFSGRWVVLISNSLSRKQITFDINQEEGRLRGKLLAKGHPEADLDGRFEDDNRIILWGTYYDRMGASTNYQFKGTYEGEPGEEVITGKGEWFDKRYDFTAKRSDD